MIVYYSGTGNTKLCADILADRLQDEAVDLFPYIREGRKLTLSGDRPYIFVTPTYGWQIPHMVRDILRNSRVTESGEAYFVMTCGSEIGNAPAHNRKLCESMALSYRGTLEVRMPENYIAMFDVPPETEAKAMIRAAEKRVAEAAADIAEGRPFADKKAGVGDVMRSGIVNTVFYGMVIRAKPFYATDACISCGKCTEVCPLNNIRMENGRPQWGEQCTHCMSCISKCPREAIEYGKASQGKPRYLCENYIEDVNSVS